MFYSNQNRSSWPTVLTVTVESGTEFQAGGRLPVDLELPYFGYSPAGPAVTVRQTRHGPLPPAGAFSVAALPFLDACDQGQSHDYSPKSHHCSYLRPQLPDVFASWRPAGGPVYWVHLGGLPPD